MTKGEIDEAVRRAFNKFDEWNNVTGLVQRNTSYYYELQGCIDDAVHCGIQAAIGILEPLPSDIPTSKS